MERSKTGWTISILRDYRSGGTENGHSMAPFGCIKALIEECSSRAAGYGDRKKEREVCLRSGISKDKFGHFLENRPQWDKFAGAVPVSYLEAIGITREMLETALKVDIQAFKFASLWDRKLPTHSFIPGSKWFWPTFRIPGNPKSEAQTVRAVIENILQGKKGEDHMIEINNRTHCFRTYSIKLIERTAKGGNFRVIRRCYQPALNIDNKGNVSGSFEITDTATIERKFDKG